MRDNKKTKAQLIKELSALRKQILEFEDLKVGPKQVVQKLKKSEELNRRIVEAIAGGMVQIGPDGAVLHANAEAERILGLSYNELTKRYVQDWESETIWEDGSPCPVEEYPVIKCLQTGESQPPATIGVRRPDGEVIWAIFTAVPIVDFDTNKSSGAVVTFLDITERKCAEKALLESEERYRALCEAAFEGIVISQNGKLVMANKVFAKMFGYELHEVIGLSPVEMTTPESAETIMKNIQSSYEKPYEVIGVKKNGSSFNYEVLGKDCLYKSRKARVAAVRDITERKKAERALLESESRFRSLVEAAPSVVLCLSRDRKIIEFNPEAERLYTKKRHEVLGKDYFELFLPPEVWDDVATDLEKVLAGEPTRGFENVVKISGNIEKYFIWNVNPLLDSKGESVGIIAVGQDITDRKLAEEALSKSEFKFRVLSETTSAAIFIFQGNRMRYVNPAAANMTGYTEEELVKMNFWEVIHPDFQDLVKERGLARQKGKKVPSRYEVKIQTKNGDVLWVDFTANHTEFKQKPATLGTAVDITDRKNSQALLQERESRFRALIEHGNDVTVMFDAEGNVSYISPSGKKVIGYDIDELVGQPGLPIVHPDDKEKADQKFAEALQNPGRPMQFSHRLRHKNGSYVTIEGMGTNLLAEPGIEAMVSNFRDITERKLAEEIIRENEERYKTLVEYAPDAIVILDTDTKKFVDANKNAEHLYGLDREALFEVGPIEMSPPTQPDGRPSIQAAWEKIQDALAGGTPRFEWTHVNSKGEQIPCEIHLVRMPVTGRNLVRGNVTDITERKQIEAQLLQSQKMETIGTLAGGVAHDFNNILTAIVGNAELGMQSLGPDHRPYDDLFEIKKAAIKASDLTNQLLSFSRRQILKKQSFNLNKVVEDLLKMLKRILGEDIVLKTEFAPSLPQLFADKGQIHQVLMNLFTNARDAMPSGGKLLLETRSLKTGQLSKSQNSDRFNNKTYLQLSVTDTGMGMGRELQAHIFEPFFTTKELGKGTGLGLAVVYGIVKQHDGHLEVESKIDRGTTFKIFLPAATKRQQKKRPHVERRINTLQGGSETILIVEDEEIVRNVAVRIVNGLGYKVLLAKNGEEAMKIFNSEKNSIDLVVMDVVMPKESGPEIYKKMNSINPKLPVLFVTGYDAESKVSNLTQGFNQALIALLQKPYSKEILGHKIRELLDE